MDVLLLSRLQFALNITFHYLFPPMSIGIVCYIVLIELLYLKTKSKFHLSIVKFWTKIFALFFVMLRNFLTLIVELVIHYEIILLKKMNFGMMNHIFLIMDMDG